MPRKSPITVNPADRLLWEALKSGGRPGEVANAIGKGANIEVLFDGPGSSGRSPLAYCAEQGYVGAAKVLLEAGANRWGDDIQLNSPLYYAVKNDRNRVFDVLVDGFEVSAFQQSVLLMVAFEQVGDVVQPNWIERLLDLSTPTPWMGKGFAGALNRLSLHWEEVEPTRYRKALMARASLRRLEEEGVFSCLAEDEPIDSVYHGRLASVIKRFSPSSVLAHPLLYDFMERYFPFERALSTVTEATPEFMEWKCAIARTRLERDVPQSSSSSRAPRL